MGEVRHGYATGHIWGCSDEEEGQRAVERKLSDNKVKGWEKLKERYGIGQRTIEGMRTEEIQSRLLYEPEFSAPAFLWALSLTLCK